MNTDNNHLVTFDYLKSLSQEMQKKYEPVPDSFAKEARKLLKNKKQVRVKKHSQGPISVWAAAQRAKRNGKK